MLLVLAETFDPPQTANNKGRSAAFIKFPSAPLAAKAVEVFSDTGWHIV